MEIINQSHEIIRISEDPMSEINKAARTCYLSELKDDKQKKSLVKSLIKKGHLAMLEFSDMTVKFTTDRGVTHELVRHRLCSFAQESTRYCNYSNDKFNGEIKFISPIIDINKDNPLSPVLLSSKEPSAFMEWVRACKRSEAEYLYMLTHVKPQIARSVLNNSVKAEIVVKANFREWMHIFNLRTSQKAHPQMRALILPLHAAMARKFPVIFGGIKNVLN